MFRVQGVLSNDCQSANTRGGIQDPEVSFEVQCKSLASDGSRMS